MKTSYLVPVLALLSASFAFGESKKNTDQGGADCCAVETTAETAVCPVSGEPLGSMGEAYVHVHREAGQPDREVKLCCKRCVPRFEKDPARYLSKGEKAASADCCAARERVASRS